MINRDTDRSDADDAGTLGVSFTEMSAYRKRLGVAKVVPATEYVRDLLEGGETKIVVFGHHLEVLHALHDAFADVGSVLVCGETSLEDRQAAVDRFQTEATCRVFVGGIMAAGVGLTLTAAQRVVMVEMDWVPGNLAQAEDRLHRIGQTGTVQVDYLTVPGSLDEYMMQMVAAKLQIADAALDTKTDRSLTAPEPRPVRTARAPGETSPAEVTVAPEVRARVLDALQVLAGVCDGAARRDGAGFNKMDASLGQGLARLESLTDRQAACALKMVRKYRKQLGAEFADLLGSKK